MKTKTSLLVAACIASTAFVSGCFSMPVGWNESSIPVEQGKYTVLGEPVEGVARGFSIAGFQLSDLSNPQVEAYQKALKKAEGADALIEMATSVEIQMIPIPIVMPQMTGYRVRGIPVKLNK